MVFYLRKGKDGEGGVRPPLVRKRKAPQAMQLTGLLCVLDQSYLPDFFSAAAMKDLMMG